MKWFLVLFSLKHQIKASGLQDHPGWWNLALLKQKNSADELYAKPDDYEASMRSNVKSNYEKCLMFRPEERCLRWIMGNDYFWT